MIKYTINKFRLLGGFAVKLGISQRIIFSFLILTTAALSFLGMYLLDFFYQQNLESKTSHLITNAKIIEKTLEKNLYDPTQTIFINEEIRKISDITNLRITIVDSKGNVMADSWEPTEQLDNHLTRVEVQGAFHHEYATAIRYSSTISQNMLYVAVPVYKQGELVGIVRTATTLTPIENSYQTTHRFILTAILITILLTILVGGILAHHQTKPIKEMTRIAKKIADGQLSMRIHINTKDELDVLAHTINQLTSNLEDKIAQIDAEAKKLTLILENMDNAVILLDSYGNVTTTNHSAKKIFNITPDMLGKHSISVIGSSLLTKTAQEVLVTKQSQSINLNFKINNTKKTFQVFFAPIANQEKNITDVLAVFHDISVLQEIYDRQVEFVTNASHELKTPLTAIKGFSETLLDGAIDDPTLSKKFVTIIHNESERMSRLIKDLLQLAKLDNQDYKNQIKIEPINLNEIFTNVKSKLAPHIKQKQQQLMFNLHTPEIIVQANYDWIMQLMINLVENAIKYTPERGSIELTATLDKDFVYISVRDTGIGIAPEDLPFVFERFYRADKARSRTAGGSGIGLSLVRFIVEMFGGKITVESKQNVGTTFTFSLPLKS